MVAAIAQQDKASVGQHLYNDLEKVVLPAHAKTAHLKDTMANLGGLGTLMSGSGPTIFTLVESQAEADALAQRLRTAIPDSDLGVWVAQFWPTGIQLIP
jgi:4-diphosphocytidyl-2-C-methyl-D-erythritol kinase